MPLHFGKTDIDANLGSRKKNAQKQEQHTPQRKIKRTAFVLMFYKKVKAFADRIKSEGDR